MYKQTHIRKTTNVGATTELYGRKTIWKHKEGRDAVESPGRLHRGGDIGDRHKNTGGKEKEA